MSTENVDLITSAQCRGARGLLGLTEPALASKAKLGLSTIVDLNGPEGRYRAKRVQAIAVKPSSWAGVEFIDENGGGPGVRLRKRQRLKKPK